MNDGVIKSNMETVKHIHSVRKNIYKFIEELDDRARNHDQSKLESPEQEIFGEHYESLGKTEYGTPEYTELLTKVQPALDHHYANNRHHPEFFKLKEEWRDVVGYEDMYKVSDHGQIRNIRGDILNPPITPKGYVRVSLFKDGASKNHFVHRLVASAFIMNPNNKSLVNHLNGIKTDNRKINLEWVTAYENVIHAYDTGLSKAKVKYFVTCSTLDISTEGCEKMASLLKSLGYRRANAASIWACINGEQNYHMDLEFEGYPIQCLGDISFMDDMTLVDLCEMLADWRAATQRNKNGNIRKSIEHNATRFNMSPQLTKIFENTVREMFRD